MQTFNIYLAGGMTGLSYEEYTSWRRQVKKELFRIRSYTSCEYINKLFVIDPSEYFNFENPSHNSEREVMEFDLYKVKNSNLIIVNFNSPSSLGTMAELAIAYENRIPVIGLNKGAKNILHPWQIEMCSRIFTDMYELTAYVNDYYLS